MDADRFVANLKHARHALGWSLQETSRRARRAGLTTWHPATITRIENGQRQIKLAEVEVASGADVKAVQRMLGHASARMTLDLYGHLFDAGLDDVAARLGEQLAES